MTKLPSRLCFLLSLAAAATAQNDRIYWVDGSVAENVRVTAFDMQRVTYQARGGEEMASSDRVGRLEVEKVAEEYKRAYGAASLEERYNQFRIQKDKLLEKPDLFLAQFGYIEAIRLQTTADAGEAFAMFDQMLKDTPQSGFIPEGYRIKLQYYLSSKGGASSAQKVAETYVKRATEEGWPDGFVHEANFYAIMADAAGGGLQPDALVSKLEALLAQVQGGFPAVASQVRLHIGNVKLQAKQIEEARKVFEDLASQPPYDQATRAGAQLGLGHVHFAQGDPANTDPYRQALLAFLRVYLMNREAPASMRAEALYFAAESADKWRGPDSATYARRLRGYLRRDFGSSEWAKR
jgi:hypothetical protein